ncbi:MAG TPA: DoxX family protein [Pyrinomonadaceae bacterium]
MNEFLTSWSPRALSVLRFVAGFLMIFHGSQKLFGFPIALPAGADSPVILIAGIIEFFGGLLILVGLFTRPAAFLMSGLMAAAYFMAHAPGGFLPLVNGGELAAIYSFLYLYLTFAGGGVWSLDSLIKRASDRPVLSSEAA